MGRKEQVWWTSATVLSLAAFSFFAGLGLRGVYDRLAQARTQAAGTGYRQLASAAPRVAAEGLKPQELFFEVLRKLQLYYVEPVPSDAVPSTALAYGAVDAMLNELRDPNTRLVSRTEFAALKAATNGEFPGLGAVITIGRSTDGETPEVAGAAPGPRAARPPAPGVRTLTVVAAAPGSPAANAGLLPGDRIVELDGRWIAPTHVSFRVLTQLTDELGPQDGRPRDPEDPPDNRPPDPARDRARQETLEARERWKNATEMPAVLQLLFDPSAGEHELTIERGQPGRKLKVKVQFGETKAPLLAARKLDEKTGYLQLGVLAPSVLSEARAALDGFRNGGVRSLVIDLRNCPGGSIETTRDLAGLLIGPLKLAVLKERSGPDRKLIDRPLSARGTPLFRPSAVSVLVDGGTAGSAELLAAALREHLAAKLVGSRTFGDGTEQEIVPLDDGSAISITRAKMLTSQGLDYDGKGLAADVAPQGDPLAAAVRALTMAPPRRAAPAPPKKPARAPAAAAPGPRAAAPLPRAEEQR